MRKIKAQHSDRDRIICKNAPGRQVFYYLSHSDGHREYLFEAEFSGSVFKFFNRNGHKLDSGCYSLALGEIYRRQDRSNPRLTHTLERIPIMVNYVLTCGERVDYAA